MFPHLKNDCLKLSRSSFQSKILNKQAYNMLDFDVSYNVFSPFPFPKLWLDGFKSDPRKREYIDQEFDRNETPPVILLHGLTNAIETWNYCGQEIAKRTGTKVYAMDARNHGDSGWSDTIDYNILPEDVVCFMDSMDIPSAILVGHSMGGMMAMNVGLRHPHRLHSLIIEDISYDNSQSVHEYVVDYIFLLREVLHKIPPGLNLQDAKKFAAELLSTGKPIIETGGYNRIYPKVWDGKDLPLRMNADRQFEWKTNLDVIEDSINKGLFNPASLKSGFERDLNKRYDGPVLMLYGTHSPIQVLRDKELFLKQFPNACYVPIEGATHLVHTEYPEQFINKVCDFILKNRNLKNNL